MSKHHTAKTGVCKHCGNPIRRSPYKAYKPLEPEYAHMDLAPISKWIGKANGVYMESYKCDARDPNTKPYQWLPHEPA